MGTHARLLVAVLFTLANASASLACFETDTTPRPWVWFTSATTAQVAIEGTIVKAAGINPGDYCAVGFGHSGTLITSISALTVMDDADPGAGPLALAGLSFTTNATTTSDLATAEPGSTWQGFHSSVASPLPGSTYAALVFTITVPASTTYQDILADLQDFAFIGLDDANAAGNLAGTLALEGVVGASELPECYDDTIQAGEVCDGLSNMGCAVGDSCVDCSLCVTGDPAAECKADILRDLAYASRSDLKCYTREAKLGQPVNPVCLADVIDVATLWLKYVPSCPQTLPASGTVQNYIDTLDTDLATLLPLGATTGAWKCAANKFKAASLRMVASTKCWSKAYNTGNPVDPVCLTRADTKYQTKFARAELPGLCDAGNTGNSAAVAARVDQFVGEIVGNIPPP